MNKSPVSNTLHTFCSSRTSTNTSPAAMHQLIEERLWVPQEVSRGRQLSDSALLHDEDPVRVKNGVDAVSDGEDRAGGKLLTDGCLNQSVRFLVHAGSGFVNAQHLQQCRITRALSLEKLAI